jgi:hypothetical protein
MQAKRVPCVEDDRETRDMLKFKFKLGLSDFEAVVAPDIDAALRLDRARAVQSLRPRRRDARRQ